MALSCRLLILVALLLPLAPQPLAAQEARWYTGSKLPEFCVDATRPDTLLLSHRAPEGDTPAGSYAFNWVSGELTPLAPAPFDHCNPANGLLYARLSGDPAADAPALLFSSDGGEPRTIARMPTHLAHDGSLFAYSLGAGLWASADGGRSWQERRLPTEEPLFGLAVAPADGRALYLLAGAAPPAGRATPYTIFFSPDAGVTWERRGSGEIGGEVFAPELSIATFASLAAPVDTVLITTSASSSGRFATRTTYLSADGGRSFAQSAVSGAYLLGRLLMTREGLLRLSGSSSTEIVLERSVDGGRSWRPLPLPFEPRPAPLPGVSLKQAFAAPDVLVLSDEGEADWLSVDGGQSWRPLEPELTVVGFTPSLPLRALVSIGSRFVLRDIPGAEQSVVRPALAKGLPGGGYAGATGHNLGGLFRAAWERGGGLAVFGYPISEPFREVNPADGRVYLVQYFERNRFEYHPELAGTAHEVLLGLLGSQVAAGRQARGEAPFQPVDGAGSPDSRYFPETGHTLSGEFRAYWERGGGLAVFGYPISEPFREANPADGRVYLVQYFERNRFEYHPELAGTAHEVLLGLLGSQVLRERGWYEP